MTSQRTRRFDGDLVTWHELPEATRLAVAQHTGPITTAHALTSGFNSQFTAVLDTPNGLVFTKGVRATSPRAWMQANEASINPHVTTVSPRLIWEANAGGWHLLGFEHIAGRTADYQPGSPDLAPLAATLSALAALDPPHTELPTAQHRWQHYCDQPDLLAGDNLVHADLNPGNVLLDDNTAWLIDWAWPVRGTGCIDPANCVMWLIIAGHTPTDAEAWANQIPGYSQATPAQINAYAQAQKRRSIEIAHKRPYPWEQQMAHAATLYASHRGIT